MGWNFGGTKTKRSTRLTKENRQNWNYYNFSWKSR